MRRMSWAERGFFFSRIRIQREFGAFREHVETPLVESGSGKCVWKTVEMLTRRRTTYGEAEYGRGMICSLFSSKPN